MELKFFLNEYLTDMIQWDILILQFFFNYLYQTKTVSVCSISIMIASENMQSLKAEQITNDLIICSIQT